MPKEPETKDHLNTVATWFSRYDIEDVEICIADLDGIVRGKSIPVDKFLSGIEESSHRIPESVFIQSIVGQWSDEENTVSDMEHDVNLIPDFQSLSLIPWCKNVAQVICDCYYKDGTPVDLYSRQALHNVLDLYKQKELYPIVSPELEFYLIQSAQNPDIPFTPPLGKNGRMERVRQGFNLEALGEYEPITDQIYRYCEVQSIDVDTLSHEEGPGQIEMNLMHGDPMSLADQVFRFKRTVRQVALEHNIHATFMAKPMSRWPGSAMHVHQSVVDGNGRNIFANKDGTNSKNFYYFIGGLQKYLPCATLLFAPNVNSYRRFSHDEVSSNTYWGIDNRTCGLRIPVSKGSSRRIETRVGGADCNPYLMIAASLLCGYLGMIEKIEPDAQQQKSVYGKKRTLPKYLYEAFETIKKPNNFTELFGKRLINVLINTKENDFHHYHKVISSWEREHLVDI